MSLSGKKIILGISGSIAAYKTPELVRQLIKAGAEVRVIATPAALDFVSALSLSTVSKYPVLHSVSSGEGWNNHVEMGLWADALMIAPCSAHTLARLAHGFCDTLLNAVYLSARCPVFIAPAMDEDMWRHPSTRQNVRHVAEWGNHILPVGHGELASGLVGEGRMAEPHEIVAFLNDFFSPKSLPLKGQKALVTAGPTYEKLDPVRFIGNFSSGKMGLAIAQSLADAGAEVTLVQGPGVQGIQHQNIHIVRVQSAQEMYEACASVFPDCRIAVMAAAVADYRPATMAQQKIKKQDDALILQLTKTTDILATLGSRKRGDQLLVGFALETENELAHAQEKQVRKNADIIVLNSLAETSDVFGADHNKVTLITARQAPEALPLLSKQEVARALVQKIISLQDEKETV